MKEKLVSSVKPINTMLQLHTLNQISGTQSARRISLDQYSTFQSWAGKPLTEFQ